MSSISLVRPPSWPGLVPGRLQWLALDDQIAASVRSAFGLDGRVLGLGRRGEPPLFRLEREGGPPLFLKLVASSGRDAAVRAEAVARHLAACGFAVPAAIEGFPRALADGRLAVALPFVEGRPTAPQPAEMHALGRAIGALHRALAAHSDVPAWRASTDRRLAELAAVRAALADGSYAAVPEPARLRALAADATLDFVAAGQARTPLHGDLNPGNVLVEQDSGRVVILDFEDVFHSVLPPRFELLLAMERHILVQVDDDALARPLVAALRDGYGDAGAPLPPVDRPADVLRSLALRSLCVLALGAREGRDGGADEWGKFLFLEVRARARAGLLSELFAG